jgi:hypothetical protein
MENRHSSPSQRDSSPRPTAHRNRSNSLPIVEALGCSTPEAELILAEGRAAVRRRHDARRGRPNRSGHEDSTVFRPQDHLPYLNVEREPTEDLGSTGTVTSKALHHSRTPSNLTDRSTSTITGPTAPSATSEHTSNTAQSSSSAASPLWDYSANLAKFIQTQLNSISSYYPNIYPRSPFLEKSPPTSPTRTEKRPVEVPGVIEMPPIRPPLRSAFSEWSSTDDDTDNDHSPMPDHLKAKKGSRASRASNFTPSILRYYENSSGASFLLSSTPLEEGKPQQHPNADNLPSPSHPAPPTDSSEPNSTTSCENDYPSSSMSTHPALTSSSAPSFSSTSTASYFEPKRQISLAPHVRDRIIAAVSPLCSGGEPVASISPPESQPLTSAHRILGSQNKVLVDGMSFDLVRTSKVSSESMMSAPRMQTPC